MRRRSRRGRRRRRSRRQRPSPKRRKRGRPRKEEARAKRAEPARTATDDEPSADAGGPAESLRCRHQAQRQGPYAPPGSGTSCTSIPPMAGSSISCIMTSASTHDSQVAIPLGTLTAGRVQNLYDLIDAAYDSIEIWAHCILLGHKPIIDVNPRRSVEMQEALSPSRPQPGRPRTLRTRLSAEALWTKWTAAPRPDHFPTWAPQGTVRRPPCPYVNAVNDKVLDTNYLSQALTGPAVAVG